MPVARLHAIEDAREVAGEDAEAGRAVDQPGAALVVVGLEGARVEAAQVDARAAHLDGRGLVAQEPHRRAVQVGQRVAVGERVLPVGVVVVAEHGEGAERRVELRQRAPQRGVARAPGTQVAGDHDQVRLRPPDQLDAPRERPDVQAGRAHVEVRQVADPETVEGRIEARDRHLAHALLHPLGLEEPPGSAGRARPTTGHSCRSSAAFLSLGRSVMVGRARPGVTRRTLIDGARVTAWQPPAAKAQPGAGGSFRRRPPPGWRAFMPCPGTRSRRCTPTTARGGAAGRAHAPLDVGGVAVVGRDRELPSEAAVGQRGGQVGAGERAGERCHVGQGAPVLVVGLGPVVIRTR